MREGTAALALACAQRDLRTLAPGMKVCENMPYAAAAAAVATAAAGTLISDFLLENVALVADSV